MARGFTFEHSYETFLSIIDLIHECVGDYNCWLNNGWCASY